jgi:hypothetical protein
LAAAKGFPPKENISGRILGLIPFVIGKERRAMRAQGHGER